MVIQQDYLKQVHWPHKLKLPGTTVIIIILLSYLQSSYVLVDDGVVLNRNCFQPIDFGNDIYINWKLAENFCVNNLKGILAEFESIEEKDKVLCIAHQALPELF